MLSMIINRADLYQRIWQDYHNLPSDRKQGSFFYRYLKDKKDAQARRVAESAAALAEYSARKKRDKYILLRSAYLAYKSSLLSEEEYIARFNELTGARERKKYEPFTADRIDETEQAFERAFLLGCINDFFYNLGYRVRKNEEQNIEIGEIGYAKTDERYLKEKDGYIDDLDLWASYCTMHLQHEPQPPGFVSELTDEYIGKCSRLFSALNREERSDIFVPLYFDASGGAGVTVIGNDMLPEKEKSDKACRICIMYFSYLDPSDGISEYGEFAITMMTELYDDVADAFDRFRKGVFKLEYTENYGDQNGEPPSGIDSIFNRFFSEEPKEAPAFSRVIEEIGHEESLAFGEWQHERDKHLERTGITK